MRTSNQFIALQYTKSLIEDQKDGRALSRTAGQQAMLASETKETLRTDANERRLMTKQLELVDEAIKVGEKALAAISQVAGVVSGAAMKVPDVAPKEAAPKPPEGTKPVPKVDDAPPKNDPKEKAHDAEKAQSPLERYVRDNFVMDTMDDVKKKAYEELEKKIFQALNIGTESYSADAKGASKVAEEAKATAKQASGLATGQKIQAQRLVDMLSRAPADV